MKGSRLLMHPLLLQKRSVMVLTWYLIGSGSVFGLLWWNYVLILQAAGINLHHIPSQTNIFLSVLLSPYFRLAVFLMGVTIAAAITSRHILGPLKRIEQWLNDLDQGQNIPELRLREADEYAQLAHLINDLHVQTEKNKPPWKEKSNE